MEIKTVKTLEALKLASENGKSIRPVHWHEKSQLKIDSNGNLIFFNFEHNKFEPYHGLINMNFDWIVID